MRLAARAMKLLKTVAPGKFSEVDEMIDFMGGGGTPLHRASGAMCGSVKNMQKLIENGANNDGRDRFGQLTIQSLLRFHPASQTPDILGSGLVPPNEKLRKAVNAVTLMNKAAMAGGHPRVAPAAGKKA